MTKSILPANIVLYADDDPDDLMLVEESFSQYSNVEVVTAKDGLEALSYLRNLSSLDPLPCLIILDIHMPKLSGTEALKSIRSMERFQHVPIILFTTSSQPHDRSFAAFYKAGFISKPLDLKQMKVITDKFIEHCAEEVRRNIYNVSQ
jgi:CheY-like chemotaxis protein